jgi:hypothetical protein
MSEYLWIVQMDIPSELEADFNRIYDTQHIPEMLKVPGLLGVKRYALEKPVPGVPKYAAHYRVTSPDVPQGQAYAAAADIGDWKPKIRPHTSNLIRYLYKSLP